MFNIGITTYNRKEFLEKCIDSIIENTASNMYKLFVYDDASSDDTVAFLKSKYSGSGISLIEGNERRGITFGFNTLWKASESNSSKYFCYLQDDTLISIPDWLNVLLGCYNTQSVMSDVRVGLFSGHHAPEHPVEFKKDINSCEVLFKKSMRATNMIAPYAFWHKIGYIPLTNPDGSVRGFPGPKNPDGSRGKGSNMDVYITGHQSKGVFVPSAAAKNCSWNLKTYCMVVPGLVVHKATTANDSTWGNPNKEI